MKFEYQLTRKDLGDYNAYYYWKNKSVSTILGAVVMIVVVLLLISNNSHRKLNVPVAAFCIALGLLFYFLLLRLQLKKYGENFKETGPMLSKKEVELTEQYCICTDEFGETKIKWRSFSKLESGKHAIYLFMESPLALIIPKSAFGSEARVTEFVNYANERIKANADMGLSS